MQRRKASSTKRKDYWKCQEAFLLHGYSKQEWQDNADDTQDCSRPESHHFKQKLKDVSSILKIFLWPGLWPMLKIPLTNFLLNALSLQFHCVGIPTMKNPVDRRKHKIKLLLWFTRPSSSIRNNYGGSEPAILSPRFIISPLHYRRWIERLLHGAGSFTRPGDGYWLMWKRPRHSEHREMATSWAPPGCFGCQGGAGMQWA